MTYAKSIVWIRNLFSGLANFDRFSSLMHLPGWIVITSSVSPA